LKQAEKERNKESEDQDQQMKTVYPDSSRFDAMKKWINGLDEYSIEVLTDSIKALEDKRDKEIEEIKLKYKKRIDYIKNAIIYKGLTHN